MLKSGVDHHYHHTINNIFDAMNILTRNHTTSWSSSALPTTSRRGHNHPYFLKFQHDDIPHFLVACIMCQMQIGIFSAPSCSSSFVKFWMIWTKKSFSFSINNVLSSDLISTTNNNNVTFLYRVSYAYNITSCSKKIKPANKKRFLPSNNYHVVFVRGWFTSPHTLKHLNKPEKNSKKLTQASLDMFQKDFGRILYKQNAVLFLKFTTG